MQAGGSPLALVGCRLCSSSPAPIPPSRIAAWCPPAPVVASHSATVPSSPTAWSSLHVSQTFPSTATTALFETVESCRCTDFITHELFTCRRRIRINGSRRDPTALEEEEERGKHNRRAWCSYHPCMAINCVFSMSPPWYLWSIYIVTCIFYRWNVFCRWWHYWREFIWKKLVKYKYQLFIRNQGS